VWEPPKRKRTERESTTTYVPRKKPKKSKEVILLQEKLEKAREELREVKEELRNVQQAHQLLQWELEIVYNEKSTNILLDVKKKEKEEKEEEKFSGILISIDSIEDRMAWARLPTEKAYEMLIKELTPYLPHDIKLSAYTQVIFDLFFFTFNTGLSFQLIQKHFYLEGERVPYSTLHDWWCKILEGLAVWGDTKVKLLSHDEWIKELSPIYEKEKYSTYRQMFFYYVDGSIIQTKDTSCPEASRAMRNGKHQCPSFVFFIIVAPTGRIVYLSEEIREGKVHDKTHFNEEEVKKKLEEKYQEDGLEEGWKYVMCGDKAYPFIAVPDGWLVYITKSGEDTKDIDEDGNEVGVAAKNAKLPHVYFDPGIARLRGVVERVIGRIKSWGFFQSKSHCYNGERVRWCLKIACGIINWSFENKIIEKL
jgi:hypothetical protein